MKTSIQNWLRVGGALALLPIASIFAEESWDEAMLSRCQGNYIVETPVDAVVAQGIGNCFLQLSQSPDFQVELQRHLALQYADSWFAYAAGEGLSEGMESQALTQNRIEKGRNQ